MKKVIITSLLILVVFIGGYFGYQQLKKRDLNLICMVFTEALQQKDSVEPDQLAYQMAEKIQNSILTPPVKAAHQAISNADPQKKYELYLQTAREIGYSSWECSAMKEFFNPSGGQAVLF